ncbi:MAG: hypothetical protein WDW36_007896 [Sanguina aurantia]
MQPETHFVLATDLDHTLVEHGDVTHDKLMQFNAEWVSHLAQTSLLVYSTGRSPLLFSKLWEEAPLLSPDILICSVGSEVFWVEGQSRMVADDQWQEMLDQGWDRDAVLTVARKFEGRLKQQDSSEQRRHKLSYILSLEAPASGEEALSGTGEEVLERLRLALAEAGLAAKVVYSGGADVDILAMGAGKGRALEFVVQQLRKKARIPEHGPVMACGDSGNDVELLSVPGVLGVVVANAHPELRQWADARCKGAAASGKQELGTPGSAAEQQLPFMATRCCSAGILEALRHHKLLPGTRGATQQQAPAPPANAGALSVGATGAPVALEPIQRLLREMATGLAQGRATQLLAQGALAERRHAEAQLGTLLAPGVHFVARADCSSLADLACPKTSDGGCSDESSTQFRTTAASHAASEDHTGAQDGSATIKAWADMIHLEAEQEPAPNNAPLSAAVGKPSRMVLTYVAHQLTAGGKRDLAAIRPTRVLLEPVSPASNQLTRYTFTAVSAEDCSMVGRYPLLPPMEL